jgi:hypothetical protein
MPLAPHAVDPPVPPWLASVHAWLYRAALAVIFAWFVAVALHGLGNAWQWGHNGYNGAAFMQGARNSLRFHVFGQALYYTGLVRPPPESIYTHHPMMLHFHLIAAQALLGTQEWVGRLVPAIYSVLGLAMLVLLARRTAGRAVAVTTAALYALTPLHLIFANMIDHEQACIFWTLAMLYGYLRWVQAGTRRWLAACLLALTVAMQWDWAAYYFAFFVALHALWTGLARGRPWLRWRREYTFLLVFSAVVLVNAGAFFLWIKSVRGGLTEMGSAFTGRSSSPDAYFERLWQRSLDLQGPLLLSLLAAWLPLQVWRILKRQANFLDFVAVSFLAAQMIHSLVFKQAGFIHCYWTYYAGPAIAIGGALVLVTLARTMASVFADLPPHITRLAFGLVLAAALVPVQTNMAWARLQWGFATGSATYVVPYDSQLDEMAFARAVASRHPRQTVKYLIHGSIQSRIELEWYLDAPLEARDSLTPQPQDTRPVEKTRKSTVLLVDLAHTGDRAHLRELAEQHETTVYGRRFFAIDLQAPPAALSSLQPVPQPTPRWWAWLVNPDRPRVQWQPMHPQETAAQLLDPTVRQVATLQAGGTGGWPADWNCAAGQVLAGLQGRIAPWGRQHLLATLVPQCRDLALVAGRKIVTQGRPQPGPTFGDQGAEGHFAMQCADGDVPVGIWGRAGSFVDSVGLLCAHETQVVADRAGGWLLSIPDVRRLRSQGDQGGKPYELRCPPHSVVWALRGRAASIVDQIGIVCAALTPEFLAGVAPVPSAGIHPLWPLGGTR